MILLESCLRHLRPPVAHLLHLPHIARTIQRQTHRASQSPDHPSWAPRIRHAVRHRCLDRDLPSWGGVGIAGGDGGGSQMGRRWVVERRTMYGTLYTAETPRNCLALVLPTGLNPASGGVALNLGIARWVLCSHFLHLPCLRC